MKRALAVILSSLAIVAAAALTLGAGDDDGGAYYVRAVFDNASFVIPGEDVKIAGVKVGKIHDVEVTDENKAAVVLKIDDPAFIPFRSDAHCAIRLQSLIGEQFVECSPTQAHAAGTAPEPALAAIPKGRHAAGQHLLPVANTTTPIGVDLLNNIMRLPEQQRLRLIISELGAGLAGNGEELRAALRRTSPALQQLNTLVKSLADDDHVLARLVDESDQDLAPLAKERKALGDFIDSAGKVGAASAERGDALEANFAKLPAFLRQLTPATDRFAALADQMTPALQELHAQAPAINETVQRLGGFTESATGAVTSLGKVADQGRKTFPDANTLAKRLKDVGPSISSVAGDLAKVSTSFDNAGGVEALMRFIYFYTGSVNGEDQYGHYIRTLANITNCVRSGTYDPNGGCSSSFDLSGLSYSDDGQKPKFYEPDFTDSYDKALGYLLGDGK